LGVDGYYRNLAQDAWDNAPAPAPVVEPAQA
jgi:hypothetical protein